MTIRSTSSSEILSSVRIDISGVIHAAGETGIVGSFSPASAPGLTTAPEVFDMSNSDGGGLGGSVAHGELISIYGLNLDPRTPATAQVSSRVLYSHNARRRSVGD
jgi:hypothetical protein